MRAAHDERQGPARDVLQVGELPDPTPGPGVRVRVHDHVDRDNRRRVLIALADRSS